MSHLAWAKSLDATHTNSVLRPWLHPETLKIRSYLCDAHRIGTLPDSFAHARLELLPGRADRVKTELAQLILQTMRAHLPTVGSLSVDVADLSPSYVKDLL